MGKLWPSPWQLLSLVQKRFLQPQKDKCHIWTHRQAFQLATGWNTAEKKLTLGFELCQARACFWMLFPYSRGLTIPFQKTFSRLPVPEWHWCRHVESTQVYQHEAIVQETKKKQGWTKQGSAYGENLAAAPPPPPQYLGPKCGKEFIYNFAL